MRTDFRKKKKRTHFNKHHNISEKTPKYLKIHEHPENVEILKLEILNQDFRIQDFKIQDFKISRNLES